MHQCISTIVGVVAAKSRDMLEGAKRGCETKYCHAVIKDCLIQEHKKRIRGTVLRVEKQDLLTTFALHNVSICYRHSVLSFPVSTLVLRQVHCKST